MRRSDTRLSSVVMTSASPSPRCRSHRLRSAGRAAWPRPRRCRNRPASVRRSGRPAAPASAGASATPGARGPGAAGGTAGRARGGRPRAGRAAASACSAISRGSRSGSGSRTGFASCPRSTTRPSQALGERRRPRPGRWRPRPGRRARTIQRGPSMPTNRRSVRPSGVRTRARSSVPYSPSTSSAAAPSVNSDCRISSRTSSQMPSVRGAAKTPSCSALSPWTSTTCWITPSGRPAPAPRRSAHRRDLQAAQVEPLHVGGASVTSYGPPGAAPPAVDSSARRVEDLGARSSRACRAPPARFREKITAPTLRCSHSPCHLFRPPARPVRRSRRPSAPAGAGTSPACPPVDPCPPAPRRDAGSSATGWNSARSTRWTTSCAIRSPREIFAGTSRSWLIRLTRISPR